MFLHVHIAVKFQNRPQIGLLIPSTNVQVTNDDSCVDRLMRSNLDSAVNVYVRQMQS